MPRHCAKIWLILLGFSQKYTCILLSDCKDLYFSGIGWNRFCLVFGLFFLLFVCLFVFLFVCFFLWDGVIFINLSSSCHKWRGYLGIDQHFCGLAISCISHQLTDILWNTRASKRNDKKMVRSLKNKLDRKRKEKKRKHKVTQRRRKWSIKC